MPNAENIVLGRADVSISPWVTNAGAGTFAALGHIAGPVTIENSWEDYEVKSEQQLGAVGFVPTSYAVKLKFSIMESLLENWRIALRLLAAQKTGTTPNFTLAIVDPTEVYHQVKFVGKPIRSALTGLGPNPGSRTILAWRASIGSVEPVGLAKDAPQMLAVTLNCAYDESIAAPTTAGRYYQVVDTAIG